MSRKKKKLVGNSPDKESKKERYGDADLTKFIHELDAKRTGKPLQLIA